MNKYVFSGLVVLLCGCAANKTDENGLSASNDEEMVCEFIAKTGSNLKKKRCMTRTLSEELEKENRHDLREAWGKGQTQAHTTL